MITNVLAYLEASAARVPEKTAFADEHTSCTYAQLETRARRIGCGLAAMVSPRSPIAFFTDKSVATAAGFLGAVYAGCFYVLLDPKQPPARLRQIADTLGQPLIVTDEEHADRLRETGLTERVTLLSELERTVEDASLLETIRSGMLDTDPLYGIFTSGSTGTPKGVVVCHRSVIDFIECFTALFSITEADILGNQAPFDFDVSIKDFYSTLKTGATMVIIPKKMFSFPTQLLDYLCERQVTTLIWAVSALCMITALHGFDYKVPQTVDKVLFSGEAMPIAHLNEWRRHLPQAMFVNLYGPTEITCNCTYYMVNRDFAPGDVLPIGQPFPNERVFLLDEQGRRVTQPQVTAELCVAGTALSLGYYNDPERTAAAFVQNPLNPQYPETIYKTGDLAYYNDGGELCFAARRDRQIKHMGHRIELGEIETAMAQADGVLRACCLFDTEKNRLLGFYEGRCEKTALLRALRERLPDFMIPRRLTPVEAMPLTKNGKIDRAALKEMV